MMGEQWQAGRGKGGGVVKAGQKRKMGRRRGKKLWEEWVKHGGKGGAG